MMRARATLVIDRQRALGWLTDQHPDSGGAVALLLDDNLARPFGPDDLPPDHIIMLYGSPESIRDVLLAAGEAGFTVTWPADDPLPEASRNWPFAPTRRFAAGTAAGGRASGKATSSR